ncbi:MAG: IS4 family transposase [bacterium]
MHEGRIVFSQLMDWLPKYEFDKCVQRYRGDYRVRSFSCHDQFLTMAFAQLTYRESLRDIETCLRALKPKLHHAGIRGNVARSTLADANEKRDWRIFADFAQVLIGQARKLYAEENFGVELDQVAYALDSTIIDLCLSLFPCANFRKRKGAVKLHTLLDLRGSFPTVVIVTPGKIHDVNILDQVAFEPGAFYIMDRGYLDFARLHTIQLSSAFFITRSKKNFRFKRRYSHPVDKSTGLRCDQTIILKGFYARKDYPEALRRICYFDAEADRKFAFLTSNFNQPAPTIANLYKCRWRIELFFKWIKQHLRNKAFYGTSENAVKTQVWIAISVYVLVAIIKKRLNLDQSLYTILQILSVTLFEKTPILQAFTELGPQLESNDGPKQLYLWDFLTGR